MAFQKHVTCPPFQVTDFFQSPKNTWRERHELAIRTRGGGKKEEKGWKNKEKGAIRIRGKY
jgi:hypothetical protein